MSLIVDMYYMEGSPDPDEFLSRNITANIHKAGDGYVLPNKENKYEWVYPIHERWDEQNHTDPLFRDNFHLYRESGIVMAAYMFCRFDRPLGVSKNEIVLRNLTYYQKATQGLISKKDRPVLDLEQEAEQLVAAGLKPIDVALMSKDIVQLFLEYYDLPPLLYTFPYWANNYMLLTPELVDFFTMFDLWIANPVPTNKDTLKRIYPWSKPYLPTYKGEQVWDWKFWQYTWGGLIAGRSFDISEPRDPNIDLKQYFAPDTQETFTEPPIRKQIKPWYHYPHKELKGRIKIR